jgi:hypothetical protein
LTTCVAVVLMAHAGLLAALLAAPASGVRRAPPHQTAAVRLVVLGRVAEPQVAPAEPRRPSQEIAVAPVLVPGPAATLPPATPEPLTAATRPALAPEAVASAPPAPQVATIGPLHDFLSPAQVDRIAIAFPSPDIASLSGLSWSGIPMRLRLFVDATGHCVDVKFLRASEDADTLERLRRMFLVTHFIPARRAGVDVDSYRDIELDVSDVK